LINICVKAISCTPKIPLTKITIFLNSPPLCDTIIFCRFQRISNTCLRVTSNAYGHLYHHRPSLSALTTSVVITVSSKQLPIDHPCVGIRAHTVTTVEIYYFNIRTLSVLISCSYFYFRSDYTPRETIIELYNIIVIAFSHHSQKPLYHG